MPISKCLANIYAWTAAHHIMLNLHKFELLFIPVARLPSYGPVNQCWGFHSIAFIDCEEPGSNSGQQTVLHPQYHRCGLILQICFTTSTRSGLSSQRMQLLVKALIISCKDYCNSLLAELLVSATKPLQSILRDLHWLPITTHFRVKTMEWSKVYTKRRGMGSAHSLVGPLCWVIEERRDASPSWLTVVSLSRNP